MLELIQFKQTEIGKIPEDWGITSIGEICWVKNGKTNSQDAIANGEYPLFDRSPSIKRSNRYLFDSESVIVPGEGKEFLPRYYSGKFDLHQRVYAISSNGLKKVNMRFIYYWILNYRDYLSRVAVGSTVRSLRLRHLTGFPIALPSYAEQCAMVKVLSDLDAKIELNRKMNETLEEIGQALFQRWFVDFEFPNEEGKSYKASGGTLVDSELGEIPAGWTTSAIDQLLELSYGKGLTANAREGGDIPVYGSNGRVGWHNKALVRGPGIVVGRKGNPGTVLWVESDFYPIDTTFYVIPKADVGLHYLFHALKSADLPSLSADSAVPGLNRNIVYGSNLILPPPKLLNLFEGVCNSITNSTACLTNELYALTHLRECLLPKLMSGEIRVVNGGGASG